MPSVIILLVVAVAAVSAVPHNPQRIVGGSLTTINQYPQMASLLYSSSMIFYSHSCGGILINPSSLLSAGHCFIGDVPNQWRARVGSSFASSGGTVYGIRQIIIHPQYNVGAIFNMDFAIIKSSSNIVYVNNAVQPASFSGSDYNLYDNQVLWASGWGRTNEREPLSEQLRHVQVYSINQAICAQRYRFTIYTINDNMLCSGILDVGGRDQCQGDSGGPLYHNNVVVGVCSYGIGCARRDYPGVNARVSRAISWIQANA